MCASAEAETIALNPARDNTLYQSASGSLSNGKGEGFFAGRSNQFPVASQLRRGLIYFDMSTIPAGATIESASLRMVSNAPGINGDRVVSLHRLLEDWGEGTSVAAGIGGGGAPATQNDATWLYRFYNAGDPSSSPRWAAEGGTFALPASASTVVLSAPGPAVWSSAQMAVDVQMWLNNPSANFGWEVIGDESINETTKRFVSRESVILADRPMLTVVYSVPEPGGFFALLVGGIALIKRRW